MQAIAVVSGGFDPIHVGHISLIRGARELVGVHGKVIVIINSDTFLLKKKGFIFMPQSERLEIIKNIKDVDEVVLSIDKDMSVTETLRYIHPKFFVNGGDRKTMDDILEAEVCREIECEMIFGVGGGKIQSSSDLVENLCQQLAKVKAKK